eukprot:3195068-Karenia_brevis.AAC.1
MDLRFQPLGGRAPRRCLVGPSIQQTNGELYTGERRRTYLPALALLRRQQRADRRSAEPIYFRIATEVGIDYVVPAFEFNS